MAWEARSGLKQYMLTIVIAFVHMSRNGLRCPFGFETRFPVRVSIVSTLLRRNGLGSPFGFETPRILPLIQNMIYRAVGMAWEARSGLKLFHPYVLLSRRNGLRCPFGVETS